MTIAQVQNLHGKYRYIHQTRQTGQKGDIIALYVHHKFDFKIIERGDICNDNIEYLTVEILMNKYKNIIFSCIYRSLIGNSSNFFWII